MARKGEINDDLYPMFVRTSMQLSKMDEFLAWQHLNLRRSCQSNFRLKWLEPMMGIQKDGSRYEQEIKEIEKLLEDNLNIVENLWLKETPYITGNKLSAADIIGACEIEQTSKFSIRCTANMYIVIGRFAELFRYNAGAKRPRIDAWLKKVREDTNPSYDKAHSFIFKFSKMPTCD